eukprot:scaffold9095_cov125-Isochrysis_galbana.AAC.3
MLSAQKPLEGDDYDGEILDRKGYASWQLFGPPKLRRSRCGRSYLDLGLAGKAARPGHPLRPAAGCPWPMRPCLPGQHNNHASRLAHSHRRAPQSSSSIHKLYLYTSTRSSQPRSQPLPFCVARRGASLRRGV